MDYTKNRILQHTQNPNVKEYFVAMKGGFIGRKTCINSRDVWMMIMSFAVGSDVADISAPLKQLGSYAFCFRNPALFQPKAPDLFPVITLNPNLLVEAVLHGDEAMVRAILRTNPDLSQPGEGVDFSGREFTHKKNTALTPLQAAIACGDFAADSNSTGLCEALERQRPHEMHSHHNHDIHF